MSATVPTIKPFTPEETLVVRRVIGKHPHATLYWDNSGRGSSFDCYINLPTEVVDEITLAVKEGISGGYDRVLVYKTIAQKGSSKKDTYYVTAESGDMLYGYSKNLQRPLDPQLFLLARQIPKWSWRKAMDSEDTKLIGFTVLFFFILIVGRLRNGVWEVGLLSGLFLVVSGSFSLWALWELLITKPKKYRKDSVEFLKLVDSIEAEQYTKN